MACFGKSHGSFPGRYLSRPDGMIIEGTGLLGRSVNTDGIITYSVGMKLTRIAPGEFVMGYDAGLPDGRPLHRVRITRPFHLGAYPVTQREWKGVVGFNPRHFVVEDRPGESITWADGQEFIAKLNEREPGAGYRLPTEAEWEYACRAGSAGRFCFGDDER